MHCTDAPAQQHRGGGNDENPHLSPNKTHTDTANNDKITSAVTVSAIMPGR